MMRCCSRSRSTSSRKSRKSSTCCSVSSPLRRRSSIRSEMCSFPAAAVECLRHGSRPPGDMVATRTCPGRTRAGYVIFNYTRRPPSGHGRRCSLADRFPLGEVNAMKAAFIETPGSPDVIRYGELPTPTPGQGEVLRARPGRRAEPHRPLHPRRHGRHAAAQAVHLRLRPGRRGRGGRAARRALSRSATASGAPTRDCSAGRARSRSTSASTRTGSIRRPPA